METFRDVRYAIRLLIRNRVFAIAAVSIMALGITATTTVFAVVRGVLLRGLPYPDANRLVVIRADSSRGIQQVLLTPQEFFALGTRPDIFDATATYNGVDGNLTGVDDMELVSAASVSENFLPLLGARPFAGRMLDLKQDYGTRFVSGVMISYELWQRRWHGDPGVVGRHIEFNNIDTTVVGVLPPGFTLEFGPGAPIQRHVDLWFPHVIAPTETATVPIVPTIARLRTGVTVAQVRRALDDISAKLVAAHPGDYKTGAVRLTAALLADDTVRDARPALVALSGAVAFVLLVACANLMNLLLTRASARSRELAVRTAVGASRADLVRQLTIESLVLVMIAGSLALVLSVWTVRAVLLLAPAALPQRDAVALDPIVIAFAAVVSLLAAIALGVVPAWQVTRTDLVSSLKSDPATRSKTARGLLVAAQVAFSLMLLVGAGLMARTFVALTRAPLGFTPDRLISVRTQLAFRQFSTRDAMFGFYRRAVDAVTQLPGVAQASVMAPSFFSDIVTYRRVALDGASPEIAATSTTVFPNFFRTAGITFVEGRDFRLDDVTTPARTPIIMDRRLADELWPGRQAAGRWVLLSPHATSEQWAEVVGVVDHVRSVDVHGDGLPEIYVTWPHRPSVNMAMLVRASGDPRAVAAAVKTSIERMRPARPAHPPEIVSDLVKDQRADTTFASIVLGAFAVLGLALAAIGVYGTVAYATARRMRELAVRRAIGATARHIILTVTTESAVWIAVGVAVGSIGAVVLGRFVQSLLYGIAPTDALTFAATTVTLALVAAVSAAIPAMRATRIDPMTALRED